VVYLQKEFETDDTLYKHSSTIAHYGATTESGHYITYARATDNQFIKYNDENVRTCVFLNIVCLYKIKCH
jgi:uncharacterized UBP type Zn finger protein